MPDTKTVAKIGGWTGTTSGTDKTFTARVGDVPQSSFKSTYTRQFDLVSGRTVGSISWSGTLGGIGGKVMIGCRLAPDSGVYGAWTAETEVAPGANLTINQTARYVEVKLVLDDSGFRAGGKTEIDSLVVYYQ